MLATMSPELQVNYMQVGAYDKIRQLRETFQTQARTERFEVTRSLNCCKMADGSSVSAHVMKMQGYLNHLERLGNPVPQQLAIDFILASLSKDYKQFVINYNMNNVERPISELHQMLKTVVQSMKADPKDVLMIKERRGRKRKGSFSGKGERKWKNFTKAKRAPKVAKDTHKCFECGELGHWKRNSLSISTIEKGIQRGQLRRKVSIYHRNCFYHFRY